MNIPLPRDWAGFRWESTYAALPSVLYRRRDPAPVKAPKLVALNAPLAAELGLDAGALSSAEGVALLAGNGRIEGTTPIAQAYGGHQFGHFTILGDGRALLLGEHRAPSGRVVDVQWKGSGRTEFSRGADGRLAIGPGLREFLVSEAMSALGIRTTRSLAVVSTGDFIQREGMLPGAVLMRIAASHVRVGTFQFALISEEKAALPSLVEYCIGRHFPELGMEPSPGRVRTFYERVIDRQAELVARWLAVGFVHGVMNTDNTTISGETIDFGPCAFLDEYNAERVFSSIDQGGRYAFGQQPGITGWNLARFGETLIPLLGKTPEEGVAVANEAMEKFPERFGAHLTTAWGAKLGLARPKAEDVRIVQELLAIAGHEKMDFHGTWLAMTDAGPMPKLLPAALGAWGESWAARLREEGTSPEDAVARMRRSNPVVVPRNHRVEQVLESATHGDLAPFERLLAAVRTPFADTPETRELGAPPAVTDPSYRTFCGT